jgi:ferritin-like metal-binding protein YciE
MELESLRDLYIEELNDLYSAENQLVKALPKMAKAATAKALKNGFQKHLKQTKEHVNRLEKIFDGLGVSPGSKTCQAMKGLIAEGEEVISEDAEPDVKDAALIAAAQRVEHYEIAGYGCVRTYAQLLGNKRAAQSLQKTLDEEGATDKTLTTLARKINVVAKSPSKNGAAKNAKRSLKSKPLGSRILEAVGLE